MKRYGSLYKAVEFAGKIIKKNQENILLIETIEFLKYLDNLQENNYSITLSIHANDGLWCNYNGSAIFFIKPTQNHIMFHVFEQNSLSDEILKEKDLFLEEWPTDYAYKVWRIGPKELSWLKGYLNQRCKQADVPLTSNVNDHPRNIPGFVRQAILEDFISNGRICNGVSGVTKKHKLKKADRIEFDHILPYSESGSNSFQNVQILCMECNRIKKATAK